MTMMQRGEQRVSEKEKETDKRRRWSVSGFKEPIGQKRSLNGDSEVSGGWIWNSGLERREKRGEGETERGESQAGSEERMKRG